MTASQTLQLGPRLRTRASFNAAPTLTEGLLPALTGTDSPLSNFGVVTHEPSWMATGTVNFLATSRPPLSGRAGYTLSDLHTDNVRSASRLISSSSPTSEACSTSPSRCSE